MIKRKQSGAGGGDGTAPQTDAEKKKAASVQKPGIADMLAGESDAVIRHLNPYLPGEIIGGSIPHVPGVEEEAVWNAASQACGTERVHYVYSIEEGRCWFLASPSSAMASNPDSWCPLAAALPGQSEFWDKETVYLYEQEGMACALRWDPETGRMQVFLGAARTLLPRIQSMDANFVTINPDVAKVVPWKNRQMRTEKLSRATAASLLYAGLIVNFICLLILLFQFIFINFVKRDLETVQTQTEKLSTDLMLNAYSALQSDTIKHMVRIQGLLDALGKVDGTLVLYNVDKGQLTWEALVPQSFSSCTAPALAGCQVQPGLEKDGRVRLKGTR